MQCSSLTVVHDICVCVCVCVQAYKRRAAAAERDAEAAIADVQRVADERLAAAGKRTEKVPEVGVHARACVGVCVGACPCWWCRDTHTWVAYFVHNS